MSDLTYLRLKERLTLKAEEQGIPLSGGFELTARCNFHCGMCYVQRPVNDSFAIKHELTAEHWTDLARQARDAGMLYVLLTGGDIFVRQDIQQIYESIFDLGLIPTIYTNGSLIRPDIIRWLKNRPPQAIDITLYGASAEMYEKVCGAKEGYENVVRNVDLLLDAGFKVELSTTVIEKNVNDYEALLNVAESRGVALRYSGYISPVRVDTGKEIVEKRLTPERLAQYSIHFREEFKKRHKELLRSPQLSARDNNKDCSVADQLEKNKSPFQCTAGKSMLWLNWRGNMSGCGLMSDPHSKPLEEGFLAAWRRLQKLMVEIPTCSECDSCKHKESCMTCPVRLKNETGHYSTPARYLCRYVQNMCN